VHATQLAEALTARGHSVTLYALSKAGDRLYRELSCPVILLPAEPAPSDPDQLILQRVQEVVNGLRTHCSEHDIYHAEDCLVASGLLAFDAELGCRPIVRTLHHLEHFESAYLRECQRRSIIEADAVACVSHVSQRDVQRELGRICPIIGNGVDAARFERRSPRHEQALRARLALPSESELVLSVGGVEPRKNSLCALAAMLGVLCRRPHARWLIAGGSSIWEHAAYRAEFREKVGQLPEALRDRILELGPVSEAELSALYGMSQVLLCPSLHEGFGLCVLEALAARTAVVVSQGEPFSEYLSSNVASFVDPGSASGIAKAVTQLLGDTALRAARAEAGIALARAFSWDRVAGEHELLYTDLLFKTSTHRAQARRETTHA
jgi:glycosyltransferase-like protein